MSQMSVNVRHKNDGKTIILGQVFRVRPSLKKLCENIKKQTFDMANRRQAKMLIFGVPGAACNLSRGGPGGFPERLPPRGTPPRGTDVAGGSRNTPKHPLTGHREAPCRGAPGCLES